MCKKVKGICPGGHSDKMVYYYNQVGTANPTVYTYYFYNSQGERVKKLIRRGTSYEVYFYMDGGMFQTHYYKPTGAGTQASTYYHQLNLLDGNGMIATIRVGRNDPDTTPDESSTNRA